MKMKLPTMYLLIVQILFLTSLTFSAKYPYAEEMFTKEEDNRFPIIQFIDGLFSYAEESVLQLDKNLGTIVVHLDTCIQFIIDSISTIVDISIRQPTYLINHILYAISWTIDLLVYLLLDVAYHNWIKGTFLIAKWIVVNLLSVVTNSIYFCLMTIIYLSKSIVLTYFNIFAFVFVYFVNQLFQSVFWVLSFVGISFCALWVVFEMYEKFTEGRDGGGTGVLLFIPLLLPFAYILYSIWFTVCSFIFNFIFYPLMIMFYSFIVGLFTFFICTEILEKCQQYVTALDREALLKTLHTVIVQRWFRVLGVDVDAVRTAESNQSNLVEDLEYTSTNIECIVCFEETLLVKLFPCKHRIMCYNCTIRILENDYRCPVCRETIRHYQFNEH